MGFTVSHRAGSNGEDEFEAYARLLHQQGIDLGRLPRIPDPSTGRRWLYVWDSREKAQAFVKQLKKRSHGSWEVREVITPPSEGPLGPIQVQVGWRWNSLVLGLEPLSMVLLRSAFPEAKKYLAIISLVFENVQDYKARYGSIDELAREFLPGLTGLTTEQLNEIGYILVEEDTHRTLLCVPPKELAHC